MFKAVALVVNELVKGIKKSGIEGRALGLGLGRLGLVC